MTFVMSTKYAQFLCALMTFFSNKKNVEVSGAALIRRAALIKHFHKPRRLFKGGPNSRVVLNQSNTVWSWREILTKIKSFDNFYFHFIFLSSTSCQCIFYRFVEGIIVHKKVPLTRNISKMDIFNILLWFFINIIF